MEVCSRPCRAGIHLCRAGVMWPRIQQSPWAPGPELVCRKLLAGQQSTSPQVSTTGAPARRRQQSRPPIPGKKPFPLPALQSLQRPLLTKFSIVLTFSKSLLHIRVHFLHCVICFIGFSCLISFLLLTLGLFCFSFSTFFR